MYKAKYILYIVAILSIFLMFSGNSTFAEDVDYNVNIAPALTLTTSTNSLALNLDPSSKTFDSKNLTVSVGTNNKTGYILTLSTPNDNTDLDKNSSGDSISAVLPTLSSGTYTESTFTPDRWGYKINSNTSIPSTITTGYIPFVSGNTLMESAIAVNNDQAELTFAAKVDYLQPAGVYATTLNFNIVANPEVDYIQDLDPTLCTTTPMTVLDKRDSQEYTVQRLTDGNCWMMTNLNLGATTLTTDLTSANTNLSTTVTASTFNGWKKSTGSATYTAAEYIPVSGTDSTSQTPYGTLYNYCATSAGTICTSSNSSDASYDICPAGWRLPIGGASGEFAALYALSDYNSFAKLHNSIANGGAAFALAGYVDTGNPYPAGETWDYWSSTRYSATEMYNFNYHASAISTAYRGGRGRGMTIRCVMKQTMQTFSSSAADAMATNSSLTLEDERDGQLYTVKKLGDGNVWMTRNLAIGCNGSGSTYGGTAVSRTLTSSNSNISASSWNTPTDTIVGQSGYWNDGKMTCSSSYGAWYNYVAATAGTITSNSNTTEATESICPVGWRIPNYNEYSDIYNNSNFNPSAGGAYANGGQLLWTAFGYFWSSTAYNAANRYYAVKDSGKTVIDHQNNNIRSDYGAFVRCIKN